MNTILKDVRVAYIIDGYQLVLNIGAIDGVKTNARFLIYGIGSDEIIDPVTGESLGYLELVRGTGVITYVQEKICTIKSDMTPPRIPLRRGGVDYNNSPAPAPFENVCVGDFARLI